jgi:hypothetical protein
MRERITCDFHNRPRVALAPPNFGYFSNHLFIGNAGSGQIAVYDPDSEHFDGLLRDANGHAIQMTDCGHSGLATTRLPDRAIGCSSLPA